MTNKNHSDATSIHLGAYVASSDPGAVGAKKLWIDTTSGPPYQLKVRNAGNSAWGAVGIASASDTDNPIPAGFNSSISPILPASTHDTDGTEVDVTPDMGFSGIAIITELDLIYTGLATETVTVTITATFDDATTGVFTASANSNSTHGYDQNGSNLTNLTKSGHYVTQLAIVVQSSIDSSGASVTAVFRGIEV